MHGDGDVVPLRREEVVAEADLGSESDGMEHPVDVPPLLGQCLADRNAVFGHGDVEFEHVDVVAELSRRSLGQLQRSAGAGEHDVGPLGPRQSGHPESQRGVGEDAGDHDLLAVEQTHAPDRR